jgi:hypothetical protein
MCQAISAAIASSITYNGYGIYGPAVACKKGIGPDQRIRRSIGKSRTGRFPSGNGLPVSELVAAEVLSLPMHPYLDQADQDFIVAAVAAELG